MVCVLLFRIVVFGLSFVGVFPSTVFVSSEVRRASPTISAWCVAPRRVVVFSVVVVKDKILITCSLHMGIPYIWGTPIYRHRLPLALAFRLSKYGLL